MVVFCGNFECNNKGYNVRETSQASLEREGERESLLRACYAHLSKVVVFCGNFECTSKGYGKEKRKLLSLCMRETREGELFQGLLCLPLKSGGFLWQF